MANQLKQLLSRALRADEFEKTAQATRQIMSVEKRAELFTDFISQGCSIKEASERVDSVELAFSKMSSLGELGEAAGNAVGDAIDSVTDGTLKNKVVNSVKAHPLRWGAGALGTAGAAGYAAHGSNTGTTTK